MKIADSPGGRVKELESVLEKMERKGIALSEIFSKMEDLAGVRVVCYYLSDVYEIYEFLKNDPEITIGQKPHNPNDYIQNPKEDGYRSFHCVVQTQVPSKGKWKQVKCEVQIRTALQDAWAKKAHPLTYKKDDVPQHFKQHLRILGDLLHAVDEAAELLKDEILKSQR